MTTIEHSPYKTSDNGDEVLASIDAQRQRVEDRFTVEKLGNEFPRFAQFLGADAIFLANTADNDAGTFKWRGAYTGAKQLQRRGVHAIVTPSAGNALRGGILAAKSLGMDIHGVVPTTAPRAKKEGARALWDSPQLQLHVEGISFDESLAWALERPELGALLHPYDDQYVIRGQGTILDDILATPNGHEVQRVVVPVGGAGLLAGIIQRRDELGRPDIAVDAIQAEGSDSLSRTLAMGEVVGATAPNRRYGGSAVHRIGHHALSIIGDAKNVHVYTALDDEVDQIISDYEADRNDLWRQTTPNFEPTTLVAVAGLQRVVSAHPNDHTVVVGTGYNDALYPSRSS